MLLFPWSWYPVARSFFWSSFAKHSFPFSLVFDYVESFVKNYQYLLAASRKHSKILKTYPQSLPWNFSGLSVLPLMVLFKSPYEVALSCLTPGRLFPFICLNATIFQGSYFSYIFTHLLEYTFHVGKDFCLFGSLLIHRMSAAWVSEWNQSISKSF